MSDDQTTAFLRDVLSEAGFGKLRAFGNARLERFVADAIKLGQPESVFVCTDSVEDIEYLRELAIRNGEEERLATAGHTIHWDGYRDQGRDKVNTRYLVPAGEELDERLARIDREEGLEEILGYLRGSMAGKKMLVCFFCLGPEDSEFAISGVQVTDSAYVAHSNDLLYRRGYEEFRRVGDSESFFRVMHSAGELVNGVSANVDKRRIYIDLQENTVYSVNTQYAGNTVGFKKLSLRLAIRKADREGWLAEHMLVMGVRGPGERVSYFTGAFPSGCGKTSTAMLRGETIVGDDIAYLRRRDGRVWAANVEEGIFGIIKDINEGDDPAIWELLQNPGEIIFSNVLVVDGAPYWQGDGREESRPKAGRNHSEEWEEGDVEPEPDKNGKPVPIPISHPNARYTIRLTTLGNLDAHWNDKQGVPVSGIVYGGRDDDTSVPVQESFGWEHGVVMMGAGLESKTTAQILGEAGKRVFQPMSNMDFVSLPLARYIRNHLDFAEGVVSLPVIFGVNYFLEDPERTTPEEPVLFNTRHDKHVWLKWMERRVHGEVDAIDIVTGRIPLYEDLVPLFAELTGEDYSREAYEKQFSLRVLECLSKLVRIERFWGDGLPEVVRRVVIAQRKRLHQAAIDAEREVIPPSFFEKR